MILYCLCYLFHELYIYIFSPTLLNKLSESKEKVEQKLVASDGNDVIYISIYVCIFITFVMVVR